MTSLQKRAEELLARYFDENVKTECGCSACTTTTYTFREGADYDDLVKDISSALLHRSRLKEGKV